MGARGPRGVSRPTSRCSGRSRRGEIGVTSANHSCGGLAVHEDAWRFRTMIPIGHRMRGSGLRSSCQLCERLISLELLLLRLGSVSYTHLTLPTKRIV